MAHGNFSDLVFLAFLAAVVQWLAFPGTLFQDLGPLKAQLSTQSADTSTIIKLGAGLLLMIGMTFSGVSWNPKNCLTTGIGGFIASGVTAYSSWQADSGVFVPRLFYIYAAVLFIGSVYIFVFPSNPVPPKTPETKNNHGNFADLISMALLGLSLLCYIYPDHLFQDFGPFKAQFKTKTSDLSAMIRFIAGLLLVISMMLFGIKWNPINGKMAGFGGFIAAGIAAYSTFKADMDVFVPRAFYIYAAVIFLAALHIFAFPSNPKISKASPDEKQDKKKA